MIKPEKESPERDDFTEKAQAASAMAIKNNTPALDDIPEELKAQLIGVEHIELENQVYDAVAALSPGNVTVNKVIMAIYERHKKIAERGKTLRILNALAGDGKLVKNISPRGFSLPNARA